MGLIPKGKASSATLERIANLFIKLLQKMTQPTIIETNTDRMGARNEPHIQPTKQLQIQSNETPPEPSLGTTLSACPEFKEWALNIGHKIKDWRDAFVVACNLRPMIGVPDKAWEDAQKEMGPSCAAAAFALLFDKIQAGDIHSPRGYLRGMTRKAKAGELFLERSFHGRLSALQTCA